MNPLFKPIKNLALIAFLAASIMITLTSCDQNRLDGCEGDIIVENEIPDLVMHLGDEPFRRDVFDEPVVFRHTAGSEIVITNITANLDIVFTGTKYSETTNRVSIIEVGARNVGTTDVTVIVADDCLDRFRTTSFHVTVLDNEDENND